MADGDVVLNRNFEIDAEEGTRVELFAVEDATEPGGYHYRFQYYAPEESEEILRYDNATIPMSAHIIATPVAR